MALLKPRLLLCMLCLWLSAMVPAHAEGLQLQEQAIKAGLLYNFLKYIEWPPAKMTAPSMAVCIYGSDPFGGYLEPMAARTVKQKGITIRNVSSVKDAASCNLLFINADEKEEWPQLRAFLAGKSVLTVSDFPEFAEQGGMIEFGKKDDHISVELNMDALTAAQLRVQHRLLRLVTVVHDGGGR